jgi:hypothetical protein
MKHLPLLALTVTLLAGCYHARIETGLTPSAQVIEETFASSWIYGLVPPNTVNTAEQCPDGVAVVETELSFVNQLVGFITFGIYTPMHIKVTCAAGTRMGALEAPGSTLVLSREATPDEVVALFSRAADQAADQHQPVYVQFAR